jgi:hypothetical protein
VTVTDPDLTIEVLREIRDSIRTPLTRCLATETETDGRA